MKCSCAAISIPFKRGSNCEEFTWRTCAGTHSQTSNYGYSGPSIKMRSLNNSSISVSLSINCEQSIYFSTVVFNPFSSLVSNCFSPVSFCFNLCPVTQRVGFWLMLMANMAVFHSFIKNLSISIFYGLLVVGSQIYKVPGGNPGIPLSSSPWGIPKYSQAKENIIPPVGSGSDLGSLPSGTWPKKGIQEVS